MNFKAPSRSTPASHQRNSEKLARIPIKVQVADKPLRKPDWIRIKLGNNEKVKQLQQILRNNSDIKIGHIIVEYYFVDGEIYNKLPIGEACKDLVIQTRFICFSKNFTDSLENLFFLK